MTNPRPADWKKYPYRPDWGDQRWFQFPLIDGYDPELGMATYYLDGFVRGKDSGRLYAVMTIFSDMKVARGKLRMAFNDVKPNFVPFEVRDSPVKRPVWRTPPG
ncbi:MAG: hypothetical protein JRG95_23145 [Deltaproteobacteria bacterium]|nr:hypothetical protein [Deltaproteobacteria bacterium]